MGLPPSVQGAGRPIIGLPPWESGFPCSHWLLHIIRREVSKMASFFSQIFLLWIFDTVVFSFQPYIIASWKHKKQLREENSISPVMMLCVCRCMKCKAVPGPTKLSAQNFLIRGSPHLKQKVNIFWDERKKPSIAFATWARKLESANILIS